MEEAIGMSSGVVSLMFVYSPTVILTGAGSCSMIETSSVTSSFSAATFAKPFLSRSGRITCGVWISQRVERSMVRFTNCPSSLSFTVAFIGTASTAAPCSFASLITLYTSASVTSGRAASCTQTSVESSGILQKPLNTESWRSLPGSANCTLGSALAASASTSRNSSAITTVMELMPLRRKKSSREWRRTGLPSSSRNCFGRSAFILDPTPPARSTTATPSTTSDAAMVRTPNTAGLWAATPPRTCCRVE
mmetsp:Transcript_19288/g.46584  ORF Transcript_19288/g.46584 Transcript_19288/m.46584 type:complete len:250 (+) Transcript_19288:122-871(+)